MGGHKIRGLGAKLEGPSLIAEQARLYSYSGAWGNMLAGNL